MSVYFRIRHQTSGYLLAPQPEHIYSGSPLQVVGIDDKTSGFIADDAIWETKEDFRVTGKGWNVFHKKTGALLTGDADNSEDGFFYIRTMGGYDFIDQRFIFIADLAVPDFSKLVTISFPSRLAYLIMTHSDSPVPILAGPCAIEESYYNWCLEFNF